MGSSAKALPYFEQALGMKQQLYPALKYPDGHVKLTRSHNNLGFLLLAMGSYAKALPYFEQAMVMRQKLVRRMLATASEADALAFAQSQPLTYEGFLSLTAHLPDTA